MLTENVSFGIEIYHSHGDWCNCGVTMPNSKFGARESAFGTHMPLGLNAFKVG